MDRGRKDSRAASRLSVKFEKSVFPPTGLSFEDTILSMSGGCSSGLVCWSKLFSRIELMSKPASEKSVSSLVHCYIVSTIQKSGDLKAYQSTQR